MLERNRVDKQKPSRLLYKKNFVLNLQEAEDALKYYKGYTGKSVEENIALNDELLRLQQTVIERKAEEKLKASDICNILHELKHLDLVSLLNLSNS